MEEMGRDPEDRPSLGISATELRHVAQIAALCEIRLLDLFACFLIPLYTLLFTHDTRWFTTNFSVIAAARDQRHGFFLWGMLVGVYLLCVLLPVMAALPRPLWPRLCLLGGFLLLLSAVVLPIPRMSCRRSRICM